MRQIMCVLEPTAFRLLTVQQHCSRQSRFVEYRRLNYLVRPTRSSVKSYRQQRELVTNLLGLVVTAAQEGSIVDRVDRSTLK